MKLKLSAIEAINELHDSRTTFKGHQVEAKEGIELNYFDIEDHINGDTPEGQAVLNAVDAYYTAQIARLDDKMRGFGVEIDETEDA